jgi:hypothetical protein
LHSFYMPKPSYSLAFNKPDNVLAVAPKGGKCHVMIL